MKSRIALAAMAAALAACGGGDDPEAVPLSAANYVAAAREVIAPVSYLTESTSLITGVKVSATNVIFKFSKAQLPKIPGWLSSASAQVTGVIETQVEPCENVDGTLSITTNDQSGNQVVDPGDSVTIYATNCLFQGAILNGQLAVVFDSVSGVVDYPPFAFSATFTLNNLAVQYGAAVEAASGAFTLGVDVTSPTLQSMSLTVPSLSMSVTDGATSASKTVTGYAITESLIGTETSVYFSGTVNTSIVQSNALTTSTVEPFMLYGDFDPVSGQLVINAALGGKIRVTATTAGNVFIELDADGNGTYETWSVLPWSELI